MVGMPEPSVIIGMLIVQPAPSPPPHPSLKSEKVANELQLVGFLKRYPSDSL